MGRDGGRRDLGAVGNEVRGVLPTPPGSSVPNTACQSTDLPGCFGSAPRNPPSSFTSTLEGGGTAKTAKTTNTAKDCLSLITPAPAPLCRGPSTLHSLSSSLRISHSFSSESPATYMDGGSWPPGTARRRTGRSLRGRSRCGPGRASPPTPCASCAACGDRVCAGSVSAGLLR